jgi:hypothetical protein
VLDLDGRLEHLPRGWRRSKKDSANAYYIADDFVVIIFKHADRNQFGIVSKCFATGESTFQPDKFDFESDALRAAEDLVDDLENTHGAAY